MKKDFIFYGVILLLAVALWFAGPYLGLTSLRGRLYAVLGFLLVLSMIWTAYKVALRKKAKAQAMVGGTPSGENVKTDEVRKHFAKFIQTLKESKLSTDALVEFPWYLMIGPADAGKSTLLHQSGLAFKATGGESSQKQDFWIADKGAIINTLGKYALEGGDNAAWLELVDQIKKNRKDVPLNGIIVTVNIDKLINSSKDNITQYAEKIKTRCSELVKILEVKLPIYLFFTKCDRLEGFVNFFSDLDSKDLEQVWGYTFTQKQITDISDDLFRSELNKLSGSLFDLCQTKLSSEKKLEKREKIYLFPFQFSRLTESIVNFLSCFTRFTSNYECPVLRGFYFTSATQDGNTIDKILDRINNNVEVKEKKSYFTKNCFTKIVFPDYFSAEFTDSAKRSQTKSFRVGASVSVISALILIAGFYYPYSRNRSLMSDHLNDARNVKKISWHSGAQLKDKLTYLDILRRDIVLLEKYKNEGSPFSLGFYKGDRYVEGLRKTYFNSINFVLKDEIEKILQSRDNLFSHARKHDRKPGREKEFLSSTLQTYLMMSMRGKLNKGSFKKSVPEYWRHALRVFNQKEIDPETDKLAQEQFKYYLSGFNEDQLINSNRKLITRAKDLLASFDDKPAIVVTAKPKIKPPAKPEYVPKPKKLDLLAGIPTRITPEPYGYGSLPVIAYHNVSQESGSLNVSYQNFYKQLKYLSAEKYRSITLRQLKNYIYRNSSLPDKSILLAFENGHNKDYRKFTHRRLKKLNFRGILFVNPDDVTNWNDIKALDDEIFNVQLSLPELDSGTFGQKRDDESQEEYIERLDKELLAPKKILEAELGKKIELLAYPAGKYSKLFVYQLYKRYKFQAAFGLLDNDDSKNKKYNPFEIKRIRVLNYADFREIKNSLQSFK